MLCDWYARNQHSEIEVLNYELPIVMKFSRFQFRDKEDGVGHTSNFQSNCIFASMCTQLCMYDYGYKSNLRHKTDNLDIGETGNQSSRFYLVYIVYGDCYDLVCLESIVAQSFGVLRPVPGSGADSDRVRK